MASRVIHDKIPHNVRVSKGANTDGITPTVKGIQGVTPTVKGLAARGQKSAPIAQRGPRITSGGERFQTRYSELAKVAKVAGDGLNAIQTIRDSEEAAANPELAALANDPKLIAVIQRVIAKIGKEVAAMIAADKGADYPETGVNNKSSPSGMDAARPILTAEDMERVEKARAKLSRLETAKAWGDPGDIASAEFGWNPRAYDSDDMDRLIDRLEGKRK